MRRRGARLVRAQQQGPDRRGLRPGVQQLADRSRSVDAASGEVLERKEK